MKTTTGKIGKTLTRFWERVNMAGAAMSDKNMADEESRKAMVQAFYWGVPHKPSKQTQHEKQ